MPYRILLLSVCLLALSFQTSAEIYKWVDENGQVHFGDRVPENKAGEKMDIPETTNASKPTSAGDRAAEQKRMSDYRERQKKLLDVWDKERSVKKKKEEKRKKEKEKLALKCEKAKNRRKYAERAQRMYKENKDGTRTYLSEAQRKEAEKKLNDYIASVCKK